MYFKKIEEQFNSESEPNTNKLQQYSSLPNSSSLSTNDTHIYSKKLEISNIQSNYKMENGDDEWDDFPDDEKPKYNPDFNYEKNVKNGDDLNIYNTLDNIGMNFSDSKHILPSSSQKKVVQKSKSTIEKPKYSSSTMNPE